MIKRVKIQGYKSLKNIEIHLEPLTVIFGPNATGKSNLFDALALLSRMVTKNTLKEAFDEHRGIPLEAFCYEKNGIENVLTKDAVEFSIEVDVEISNSTIDNIEEKIKKSREGLPGVKGKKSVLEKYLRYSLTVEMVPTSGFIRVSDEKLLAVRKNGEEKKSRSVFIERKGTKILLRREGKAGPPIEHDIGLDRTIVSMPLYHPHYPHISAFNEELAQWRFYYFEPRIMREESPIKEVTSLGYSGKDLAAFYNTLKAKNEKQYDAVKRAISNLIPTVEGMEIEKTKEGILQLKVIENGIAFSSRLISEGTLRILGLLAITNPISPVTVIGFEEPENGVHPRRIQMIADLLKNTSYNRKIQIIINTHSPILPQYFYDFADKSLIVCKKEGNESRFELFKTAGQLFKRRDIEEALEEFPERVTRGDFGG